MKISHSYSALFAIAFFAVTALETTSTALGSPAPANATRVTQDAQQAVRNYLDHNSRDIKPLLKILPVCQATLGESHPTTLQVEEEIAHYYWSHHKYSKAEKLYHHLVESKRVEFKRTHIDKKALATYLRNEANLLSNLHRPSDVAALREEANQLSPEPSNLPTLNRQTKHTSK